MTTDHLTTERLKNLEKEKEVFKILSRLTVPLLISAIC